MTNNKAFISPDDRANIDQYAADTADVASRYNTEVAKKKNNKVVYTCPACTAKEGLEIVTSGSKKGIFKCFHCDAGGKGGASYLQVMHGMDWRKAYEWLASTYNVELQRPSENIAELQAKHAPNRITFRDLQLKHSGLIAADQVITIKLHDGKSIEQQRYSAGTINEHGDYTANGNDMVLWYVDLDGKYLMYKPKNGGKLKPYIRVRYQHPDLHLDKEGKPVKYRSPYGSGNQLWIPNYMLAAYAKGEQITRLCVVEGEKKADKMCLHGIPSVGIAGIHNLAYGSDAMPRAFEMLITRCQVQEVVFVIDSDWQRISIHPGKPVDQRPRTFMRAVQKFREYFYGFRTGGIDLRIFMAAGRDEKQKGMDDLLLVSQDEGNEQNYQPGAIAADMDVAITDPKGNGKHIFAMNIHPLRVPEQKLLEQWHLDDASIFFEVHKDVLKDIGEFQYGKLTYYYNSDSNQIELANQILESEKFYKIAVYVGNGGREKRECTFNYDTIRNFLYNRGIGLYEYQDGYYRMVKKDKTFFYDITHTWIQRYVVEFAETIKDREERSDVVQMLLKGNTQYLGPNNLNYMRVHHPEWIRHAADEQFMVFRNCFWRITPDNIEQRPLSELPGSVWSNQVIQFDAEYIGKPLVQIAKEGKNWTIKETPEAEKTELYEYLKCTSLFAWEKLYQLGTDDKGNKVYYQKEGQSLSPEDLEVWKMHIATKLIGWGYKLRVHRDESQKRAIICMDGLESQVGKSQGGSGKSIYALATQFCNIVFTVDGKTADMKADKFLYHGVDERTREIVIDDVGVNFPFEILFSQITNFIRVKPFAGAPITLPAPIFTITTNHSINGEGNSFKRRQYPLAFSNFFNEFRTPAHYFGHQLFTDWDKSQWNLYYNLMATAIQIYMNHQDLGRYGIESDDINRRRLRQQIGEDFLDFADGYFVEGYMLNRVVIKERVLEDYLALFPGHRKFMDTRRIKEKCKLFAAYKNISYNPGADKEGRIKSQGFEFIIVADEHYDAQNDKQERVFKETNIIRGPF